MKKVLIVTSEYKYSGPNNVIKSLFNGISNVDNIDKNIVSLRVKEDKRYIDELKSLGVSVHSQKSKFSFFYLFKLVYRLKPDAVNTHGIRADIYMFIISYLLRVRVVSTIHNVPFEDYKFRYNPLLSKFMLYAHSIVFNTKRIVKVAVSKNVAQKLRQYGAKNVKVIYNGVSHVEYNPSKVMDKKALCEKLGLSDVKRKVLFCGHLTPLKDPLIVADLAIKFPEVEFVFLGDGKLRESLQNYPNTNIKVFGRVECVIDYLVVSDIFVMPSHTEGMPMALIEAMLMDLPLICSDIPIFNEISMLEGITMQLFEVGNLKLLSKALNSVLLFEKVTGNREVALRNFTAEVMGNKYLGVLGVR